MRTRALIRKEGWVAINVPPPEMEITHQQYSFYTRDVTASNDQHAELIAWCLQTFNKSDFICTRVEGSKDHDHKRFVFKNPKDATMFRLRWL